MKYKLKSHSGAKKRFRFSSGGRIKHKKAGQRHLLSGQSSNLDRKSRKQSFLSDSDTTRISRKLPYA